MAGHWVDFALAFLALLLAFVGIILARRHDHHMAAQTEKQEQIAAALAVQSAESKRLAEELSHSLGKLSTRYLGAFPDYLPALMSHIKEADTSVKLCSTIPIQGFFSAPDEYFKLKNCLIDRIFGRHRADVSAVFSSKAIRREYLSQQFQGAVQNWGAWSAENINVERLAKFAERHGLRVEELDGQRFLDALAARATADLDDLQKTKATVKLSNERHVLNMWIADGKSAIFAFPVTRPDFANHAFWTEDRNLLEALLRIHDHYQSVEFN